jgi:16S rRNA (cytidine1402-2'-O)-methyltransferase
MGTLYLVATPIGNLEDLSSRAEKILRGVNLIAAEDTRYTRKLLTHYDIHTPCISYHEHNKITQLASVLAALEQGDVALVSDAGTPGLNDPGYELVRAALEAGFKVSPIPGPCAPVAALVASGLPTDAFLYLGYLSRKGTARRKLLQSVSGSPYTLIFLEAPHRLLAALADLQDTLGDREMAVAREMTKIHEEIFRGPISLARAHFATQEPRGEITLVIAGKHTQERWDDARLVHVLEEMLQTGEPAARIASHLASQSGWPRREIYQRLIEIQSRG